MNKKITISIVLLVLAMTSLACSGLTIRLGDDDNNSNGGQVRIEGSGELTTETRQVSGFERIEFDGIGRLHIRQGDAEALTVEAEDNIMSRINTEVEGRTLKISIDRGISLDLNESITYDLTVKDLEALSLNGLGDVDIQSLTTGGLSLDLNGAGRLELNNLQADTLDVVLNGLGSVEIDGEVDSQDIQINASGNYDAEDLRSARATVEVDGLGGAQVWVTDALDVDISGAGSVEYYGSPEVSQQITGLGRVRNAGDK